MTNWNAISAISELIAAIGMVASLAYLAVQVRQNTAQSKMAVHRATVNELGRSLQSLASSGDLAAIYVRGLQDYDGLAVEEKARFAGYLGHLSKLFEELYVLHQSGELGDAEWAGFENALASIMSYPGAQSWWKTRSSWVRQDFDRLVRDKAATAARPAIYKENS